VTLHSLLFVPSDSERKLAKSEDTVADYLRTRLHRVSGISWGAQNIGASMGIQETI